MNLSHTRRRRSGFLAILALPIAIAALSPANVMAADDEEDGKGWFVPKGTAAKNFYVGGRMALDNNDYPDSNQDGSVSDVSKDATDTGKGLILGYQINEYFAVEGGYRDFGKSTFKGTSSGGPSWAAGPVKATNESKAWDLGILGRWPIAPRWYALGYLGWSWWESKETFVEGAFVSTEKDTGGDVVYALGFEYDVGLKDRVVYRFMGSQHHVDDSEYKIDSATAEIVYRFP